MHSQSVMTSKPHFLVMVCSLIGMSILSMTRTNAVADTTTADKWIAATVNPLASDAVVEVFRESGNAVDAAIAAALTLGEVDGFNSGIGGGCLILIRTADGNI